MIPDGEAGPPLAVEVCVQGIESALAAGEGGADRIELCEDLSVGGVTPSAGAVAVVSGRLSIPVHVLIRPRGGDFVYTGAEFEAMRYDVQSARSLGAAGVVLGILNPDGTVDRPRTAALIEAARPLSVTFHKAFDASRDPRESLNVLIRLGVERVLTSGTAETAALGLGLLSDLARMAVGRLVVLPGGRITERDIPLIRTAGLVEVHIGSAACTHGRTDVGKVRRLVGLARSRPVTG